MIWRRSHAVRARTPDRRSDNFRARVSFDVTARLLFAAGSGCLIVMTLTHVAEHSSVLPIMGWGLPNSPGHYLDLFCAVSGVVLLLAAGIVRLFQSK